MPSRAVPAGWRTAEAPRVYTREDLFDLVNGQAESFFAYGFERCTVQSYSGPQGNVMTIELWQLATPADAYGLLSLTAAGEPATIGNDGDTDPGRRLYFWQERAVARLFARQAVPDETLWAFGRALAEALPKGGEPPEILDRLPADGRTTQRPLYFREEISLESELWLGGENVLGLGQATEGALADYARQGANLQLVLVRYPEANQASAALGRLRAALSEGLLVADARDDLLGAVFAPGTPGQAAASAAEALLTEALR